MDRNIQMDQVHDMTKTKIRRTKFKVDPTSLNNKQLKHRMNKMKYSNNEACIEIYKEYKKELKQRNKNDNV